MRYMFYVRSFPRALPPICSRALSCALRAPRSPAESGLPGSITSSRIVCPPFGSAVRRLPVRRQQATHPLRVGGHLGLRL
eukprot:scaffold127760_cov63-Phaeocystis_antarctica.AAC.1